MKKFLITDDQYGWRKFNKEAVLCIFGAEAVIDTAESAREGYSRIMETAGTPYDFILTDMQMENDYYPKMAGEWLIEQVQNLKAYYKTKIIIISAAPRISYIADSYGVFYIPKRIASVSLEAYKELLV